MRKLQNKSNTFPFLSKILIRHLSRCHHLDSVFLHRLFLLKCIQIVNINLDFNISEVKVDSFESEFEQVKRI